MPAYADEIVQYAAGLIQARVRLDTGEIAARFGISRSTLFRRVGNREKLMGEALWWLARGALDRARSRWERDYGGVVRNDEGRLRYLWILERYGLAIMRDQGFVSVA
ncbi:hypothetical protein ABZ319_29220 [Nocardia sp. NPDC005978]|uniref:hypothetical protein n=1 Tax=Nocardia sp. NPDC005978 TaxID=3156725 RepID=UPI0033A8DC90